jgi:hypothetical protein
MNLPHATQEQMRQMEEAVANGKKIAMPPLPQEEVIDEQPTMQIQQPVEELHESDESEDTQVESEHEEIEEETPQKINYRQMRQELAQAKKDREDAMNYAMKMQQQSQPKQQAQQVQEEDYSDLGVEEDGLVEGKHAKKILKELRDLKKEVNAYKTKATQDTVEVRLKTEYPDFYKVINEENIQIFTQLNPDLADAISQTPDMYKRGKLAYDMIKKYGIYQETNYDQEKAVAKKNSIKPKPLASMSPTQAESPLTKANAFAHGDLSKEVKNQLYREMIEAMKGK